MAKVIQYSLCTRVNRGTKEIPIWEDTLSTVQMGWSEANEAIAKQEAHNGEYTITDDGTEVPRLPTLADRIAVIEQFLEKLKAAFPSMNL